MQARQTSSLAPLQVLPPGEFNGMIVSYDDCGYTVRRKHATAHNGAVLCRLSRCAVVRWLIVVICCPPSRSDNVRSTYGLVPCSFQSFALRMFVCPVMFLPSRLPSPVSERSFFCPASPVMFYGDPH